MRTSHVDGRWLYVAVYQIRKEMIEEHGEKMGAEKWSFSTEYRTRLFEMARDRYCQLAKCERHEFPFSVDAVSMVNMQWRKATPSDELNTWTDLQTQLDLF